MTTKLQQSANRKQLVSTQPKWPHASKNRTHYVTEINTWKPPLWWWRKPHSTICPHFDPELTAYCDYWGLYVLPMTTCLSFGSSGFLPPPKNMSLGGLAIGMIDQGVNESVNGVPRGNGLTPTETRILKRPTILDIPHELNTHSDIPN